MKLSDAVTDGAPDAETQRRLHQTIKKVSEDLDGMRFNTAIAAMMEFTNHLTKLEARPRPVLETFVLLLAPFAPHLAEELWASLGHADTLAYASWPRFDEALTKADEIEVPVQINGKLRGKIRVPADADEATMILLAQTDEKIRALLEGKKINKMIARPGKLVNFVVAG
jgi:leucyl-tRNA synthetase